ncbi:MAG: mRNA interferase MazF [Blastocatellia bacterium]|jgi:mRNA interferase MazF|nr:mRNA interferase MazF [Blastocatellia bacterium]
MKEGDIVIVPLRQADGMIKNRPAVILREMPPFQDPLVCGLSTQLRQEAKNFDDIVSSRDVDFPSSGLKHDSLIRLGFLVVIPRTQIAGSIGAISSARRTRLLRRLSNYLLK